MKNTSAGLVAAGLCALVAATACSSATASGPAPTASVPRPAAAPVAVNAADVQFMSGMIPHHAQAVVIAGWAATHGARADVRVLAERIVVAQRDEIELIQNWLKDRNQPVPEASATHVHGADHEMLMPGMLNAAELAQLDRARGSEFDRLFLTFMIRHHEGAVTMVDKLFASYGAAQDEAVFRFASDVYADQTTEIDRMQTMLATVPDGERHP